MRKHILAIPLVAFALMTAGCGPEFWGGGAAGVVGTGAGYEMRAKQQTDKLEADRAAGRIDQREYEVRKDQISRFSVLR